MNKLKVLLISSVLPQDTSAGALILYRHFSQFPASSLTIAGNEEVRLKSSKFIQLKTNSILTRFTKTRYYKFSHDIIQCIEPYFDYRSLREYLQNHSVDVILTVAQGVHWMAAQKMSQEFNIPLVTIFHDWWPDLAFVHQWARKLLERKFKTLYLQSSLAFCVSQGMKNQLGQHLNAQILYPIPEQKINLQQNEIACQKNKKFTIIYAGKLSQIYETKIQEISQLFLSQNNNYNSKLSLKLFGSHPPWTNNTQQQLKAKNIYGGFISRELLTTELQNANALLVIIPFQQKSSRWAKTNFPSKLIEYCKFGKPIIIWAPEYSNAAQWGIKHQSALVVTSSSPDDLLQEIQALSNCIEEQIRLGNKVLEMSQGIFTPETIQELFINSIYEVYTDRDKLRDYVFC